MSQMTLMPVILVDEQPADKTQSKDLLWIGFDEQDRRYALKTVEPEHPLLPLTEWLCYHLCGLAGILTPDFGVVRRLDGSDAFGSRWEDKAKQFSPGLVSELDFIGWLGRAQGDVCGMFALDGFMPNHDRHFGNMLFLDAGARLRALAFDWSRTGVFAPWPWAPGCQSDKAWAWLRSNPSLVSLDALRLRSSRIKAITAEQVRDILLAAPEQWRHNFDCDEAADWWASHAHSQADQTVAMMTA